MKRAAVLCLLFLTSFILGSCVKPDTFIPVLTSATFDVEFVDSYGNYLGVWIDTAVPDSNRNIYHATTRTMKVYVYDENDTILDEWGTSGAVDGQLDDIDGMTLDKNDNVYISSGNSDRVQKFTSGGTFLKKFTHANLDNPHDIAVDKSGNVFVVSFNTDSIIKFDKNGTYLTEWGGTGTGNGKFNNIAFISVDPSGNIFVSDTENDCIQKFTNNGDFILKFGVSGSGEGELATPQDIAFDDYGYIFVVDAERGKIIKFNGGGAFIQEFGTKGFAEEYELGDPWQLYIFGNTFMIVDGAFENHIKIFERE